MIWHGTYHAGPRAIFAMSPLPQATTARRHRMSLVVISAHGCAHRPIQRTPDGDMPRVGCLAWQSSSNLACLRAMLPAVDRRGREEDIAVRLDQRKPCVHGGNAVVVGPSACVARIACELHLGQRPFAGIVAKKISKPPTYSCMNAIFVLYQESAVEPQKHHRHCSQGSPRGVVAQALCCPQTILPTSTK
jgi:hypothetical protein